MWKMALGMVAALSAGGSARAEPTEPAEPAEAPPAAANPAPGDEPPPAEVVPQPVAVEAPRSTYTTLRFRNDVGDKYNLVEVRFVMDGEALPTVLRGVQR